MIVATTFNPDAHRAPLVIQRNKGDRAENIRILQSDTSHAGWSGMSTYQETHDAVSCHMTARRHVPRARLRRLRGARANTTLDLVNMVRPLATSRAGAHGVVIGTGPAKRLPSGPRSARGSPRRGVLLVRIRRRDDRHLDRTVIEAALRKIVGVERRILTNALAVER